jgi:cell division initiation protein
MNAKDITGKVFSKGFNGYKAEEVDEYLRLIAKEMAEMQKQLREAEHKMDALGDRVLKYRADEDNLKDAMLNAQRQAAVVLTEAKEKAKKMLEDAKAAADKLIADANAQNERMIQNGKTESADLLDDARAALNEAESEAARIIDEANERARTALSQAQAQVKVKHEQIERLKAEADRFYADLAAAYAAHLDAFAAIIPQCETEFIALANAEYKRLKAQEEKSASAYVMRKQDLRRDLRADAARSEKSEKPEKSGKPAKPAVETAFVGQRYERVVNEISELSISGSAEISDEDQDAPLTFDLPFIDIEDGDDLPVEAPADDDNAAVAPTIQAAQAAEDQQPQPQPQSQPQPVSPDVQTQPAVTTQTVQFAKPGKNDRPAEQPAREAKREPARVPENLFFKKPTGKK